LRGSHDLAIRRECCVPEGHIDHEGRLDLVIRFGSRAIIVIEVKTGHADTADTAKQKGYLRWLRRQRQPAKEAVLLAVSAEEQEYDGFVFVAWQDVCIEMRRLGVEMIKDDRKMAAAMVLAFVAAVEQNLLGFSAQRVQQTCAGSALYFNAHVVAHLERFLEK
jgi:hypothetical protein